MSRQPPSEMITCAQNAHKQYNLWASLQLAQGILESAWFTKCTGKYNFFGIKANTGSSVTTHEYTNGQLIKVVQTFADYDSPQDAFNAHAELLVDPNGHYKTALPYIGNLQSYINAIAPIYATDPNYAKNLSNLIYSNSLTAYDIEITND